MYKEGIHSIKVELAFQIIYCLFNNAHEPKYAIHAYLKEISALSFFFFLQSTANNAKEVRKIQREIQTPKFKIN